MSHINFRAVILGSAISFLLDLLSGVAILLVFGQGVVQSGMSEAEARAALTDLSLQPSIQFTAMLLGALTTIAGGYIAAVMAKRLPYMNAAAVGVLGIVVGLLLLDSDAWGWLTALAFALNIPAALVGGHLAKRRLDASR